MATFAELPKEEQQRQINVLLEQAAIAEEIQDERDLIDFINQGDFWLTEWPVYGLTSKVREGLVDLLNALETKEE